MMNQVITMVIRIQNIDGFIYEMRMHTNSFTASVILF